MRQEVPVWLAVLIILVVLVVVVGAYIYLTRPKVPTGAEHGMPPHAPAGHHAIPIKKAPAPKQPQQPPSQPQ
ncbi:MAG: hypothetical protein ACUVTP_06465 [Candidatus Fervidibacter sp.]|uniref:hypothetical protein n=1 Tax=Candidatus Fervidibacter sp. TaxID=3100871 RepID=UPI00404B7ECC